MAARNDFDANPEMAGSQTDEKVALPQASNSPSNPN